MKVLKFNIDCFGVTNTAPEAGYTFNVELPDDWNSMTEAEQEEFAEEIISETAQWSW